MRHITKTFAMCMLLTIAAMLTTACSEVSTDNSSDVYLSMVTFKGNGASGAEFTFQYLNDSPLVTLTTGSALGTTSSTGVELKSGDRMLIQYSVNDGSKINAETGGTYRITLYYAAKVPFQVLGENDLCNVGEKYPNWASQSEMAVDALYRTGNYINLQVSAPYMLTQNDAVTMVIDENTINDSYPSIYLVSNFNVGAVQSSVYYASFDISYIWNNPKYAGFYIYVRNTRNLGDDRIMFGKSTMAPTPQN